MSPSTRSEQSLGSAETDDALTRDYRVYQLRRGHRYSLDDVCVAHAASEIVLDGSEAVKRYADLGSGLGSVLLMVLWRATDQGHPITSATAVEAQRVSYDLCVRNVDRNGWSARCRVRLGDLRDDAVFANDDAKRWDLVTGTPPYLPPNAALSSASSQRTHARLELRGGIEAYLERAAWLLTSEGAVVVCMDSRAGDRVERAAVGAGLRPRRRMAVVPRAGHPPLFDVWSLDRQSERCEAVAPLVVRDEAGAITAEARALRAAFGL